MLSGMGLPNHNPTFKTRWSLLVGPIIQKTLGMGLPNHNPTFKTRWSLLVGPIIQKT